MTRGSLCANRDYELYVCLSIYVNTRTLTTYSELPCTSVVTVLLEPSTRERGSYFRDSACRFEPRVGLHAARLLYKQRVDLKGTNFPLSHY